MTGPRAFIAIPAAVLALVALALPLASGADAPDRWWRPGEGRVWPAQLNYENPLGSLRVLLKDGPLATRGPSVLRAIGPQRPRLRHLSSACRCMSLSAETARSRWDGDAGTRSAVRGDRRLELPGSAARAIAHSHSLLLDRGLFRVFLPWPPHGADGSRSSRSSRIEVRARSDGLQYAVREYGLTAPHPTVSVYRRAAPRRQPEIPHAPGLRVFAFIGKKGLPAAARSGDRPADRR